MDPFQWVRQAPFYRGQIAKIVELPGSGAKIPPLGDDRYQAILQGSCGVLLQALLEQPYSGLLETLRKALSTEKDASGDFVLYAGPGRVRQLAWVLVALVEGLDRGFSTLVVCRDEAQARLAAESINEVVRAADILYAIQARRVLEGGDLAAIGTNVATILVTHPGMLARIVAEDVLATRNHCSWASLGRVILPDLDLWPSSVSSACSVIFRALHLAADRFGVRPKLGAVCGLLGNGREFTAEVWGRPLPEECQIREDSEEYLPIRIAYWLPPLVQDVDRSAVWVRAPISDTVDKLLKELTGESRKSSVFSTQRHLVYIVDISPSMDSALSSVKIAIEDHGETQIRRHLGMDSRITVVAFDGKPQTVGYVVVKGPAESPERDEAVVEFKNLLGRICIGAGGTDIVAGLWQGVDLIASNTGAAASIFLFSDGCETQAAKSKPELLTAVRAARAKGELWQLVYFALGFDPPKSFRRFVEKDLGGVIIESAIEEIEDNLKKTEIDDVADGQNAIVVLVTGRRSILPESVLQGNIGGKLPLVRVSWEDLATGRKGVDASQSIRAVVMTGEYSSLSEIHALTRRLGSGTRSLPVFVIQEAQAGSQVLLNGIRLGDYAEPMGFVAPANPSLLGSWVPVFVGADGISPRAFEYLQGGVGHYDLTFGATSSSASQEKPWSVPKGLHIEPNPLSAGELLIVAEGLAVRPSMGNWSREIVSVVGQGMAVSRDSCLAPLTLYRGAHCEIDNRCFEVQKWRSADVCELAPLSGDRCIPIISNFQIATRDNWGTGIRVDGVGTYGTSSVFVSGRVDDILRFSGGNLDGSSRRESAGLPNERAMLALETKAFYWIPEGNPEHQVMSAMGNLLRLACAAVLSVDPAAVIVAVWDSRIVLVDCAPGGNGAHSVWGQGGKPLLEKLIRQAGLLGLGCSCEGSIKDGSEREFNSDYSGCPRCTKAFSVVLAEELETSTKDDKSILLSWMQERNLLPSSAERHLVEKFPPKPREDGVTDPRRYCGLDEGTRFQIRRVVRKLFSDRLGFDLTEQEIGGLRFDFLTDEEAKKCGGYYYNGMIKVERAVPEWRALQVYAHEYFHAIQRQHSKFWCASILEDKQHVPFEGKLFVEGAAVWAESHALDCLALRSELIKNNLRQGNEYGEGFQIIKHLECEFGVAGVLRFFASGDIKAASNGKYPNLESLFEAFGVVSPSTLPS